MQENDNLDESFFDLHMSDNIQWALVHAAKWARLIAFFVAGIMVLLILYLYIALQNSQQVTSNSAVMYIIIALILVFVVVGGIIGLLINFAAKVKRGILEQDIETLEKGIASLKVYFIIAGVLYIIFIVFFILGLTQRIYGGRYG